MSSVVVIGTGGVGLNANSTTFTATLKGIQGRA